MQDTELHSYKEGTHAEIRQKTMTQICQPLTSLGASDSILLIGQMSKRQAKEHHLQVWPLTEGDTDILKFAGEREGGLQERGWSGWHRQDINTGST